MAPAAIHPGAPGRQLLHASENRSGCDVRPEREDLLQANRIEGARQTVVGGEDGFHLAAEVEAAAADSEVQRPDAERISGQHEAAVVGVPEGDGPLAIEAAERRFAPLLVRVDDDLGVRARREPVAVRLELVRSSTKL